MLLTHTGARLLETHFSASRAAAGLLSVLSQLRDTNTLVGMKSLALASARPRIYSDLRAAASLGGYHFNWSRLEGHLEISDEVVPHDRPCEAAPAGSRAGSVHETSPNSGYFLERIAASSPS